MRSRQGDAKTGFSPADALPKPKPSRGGSARIWLAVVVLLCFIQLTYWGAVSNAAANPDSSQGLDSSSSSAAAAAAAAPTPGRQPEPDPEYYERLETMGDGVVVRGWKSAHLFLKRSRQKYVIVNAKNGLGNRLRALASAMAVAARLRRPVLLIWVCDLHLDCGFDKLFDKLPFALLGQEIPKANLTSSLYQVYNYMRPEPGAIKDEPIDVDPDRHLYFKSAFMMNHPNGEWRSGGPQKQIRRLAPVRAVTEKLVTDRRMVGLHVRNVFDTPRVNTEGKMSLAPSVFEGAEGKTAIEFAEKEYGKEGTEQLLAWRRASHWSNFVPRMIHMMREHRQAQEANRRAANKANNANKKGAAAANGNGNGNGGDGANSTAADERPLQFYLAADSEDAYTGLTKRFPGRIIVTRRECSHERCDFRDCASMYYSLADMLNLARTKLILGSGYSSYSEVAAQMGGSKGRSLPILMAGRDFGKIVDRRHGRGKGAVIDEQFDLAGFTNREADKGGPGHVRQHWPRPF